MSSEQRICTLQHELIHAKHHDEGLATLMDPEREELRTRRETAFALIRLFDYMAAEQIYEGEPFAMAQELGVTISVLLDYRRWLHDNIPV